MLWIRIVFVLCAAGTKGSYQRSEMSTNSNPFTRWSKNFKADDNMPVGGITRSTDGAKIVAGSDECETDSVLESTGDSERNDVTSATQILTNNPFMHTPPSAQLRGGRCAHERIEKTSKTFQTEAAGISVSLVTSTVAPQHGRFTNLKENEKSGTGDVTQMTSDATQTTYDEPQLTSKATQMTSDTTQMTSEATQMTYDEPQVTYEATQMASEATEMTSEAKQMTYNEPQVTSEATEMASDTTQMTYDEPQMTYDEPQMSNDEPQVTSGETQMMHYDHMQASITSPPQQSKDSSETTLANNSETCVDPAHNHILPAVSSTLTPPPTTDKAEKYDESDKSMAQEQITTPVMAYSQTQQRTRESVSRPGTQQSVSDPGEKSQPHTSVGYPLELLKIFQSSDEQAFQQQNHPIMGQSQQTERMDDPGSTPSGLPETEGRSADSLVYPFMLTSPSAQMRGGRCEHKRDERSKPFESTTPRPQYSTGVLMVKPQETWRSTEDPLEQLRKIQTAGNFLHSAVFATAPYQTQKDTDKALTMFESINATPVPAAAISRAEVTVDSVPPQYNSSIHTFDGTLVSSVTKIVWLNLTFCNPNKIYNISHPMTTVFVRGDNEAGFRRCTWTITAPGGCGLKLTVTVKHESEDKTRTAQLHVVEEAHPDNVKTYCANCVVGSFSPIVTKSLDSGQFLLTYTTSDMGSDETDISIEMNVVTTGLEMNYTSPNVSGYIMSNGLGRWDTYYRNQNVSAVVFVPANHAVLISFSLFDLEEAKMNVCSFDSLSLYREPGGHLIWRRCGYDFFPLEVYNHSLRFQFLTDHGLERKGFKLYFTVLAQHLAPVSLDYGLFDCAVPHFNSFAQHFRCNLVQDCSGGEDESDCPYSSQECPGMIAAGQTCYSYLMRKSNRTWYDAYTKCREKDLDLVKLRTPGDLEAFKEMVATLLAFPFRVYMGLRTPQTAAAAVPALYKEVWQWSDKTMAYHVHFTSGYNAMTAPACSLILTEKDRSVVRYTPCNTKHNVYLVCEKKRLSVAQSSTVLGATHSRIDKKTDTKTKQFSNGSLFKCPDGHVTHNFLSCDPSTKCGTVLPVGECSVPGAGTVPMFSCDNGMQTIHYSLVCDHRRHCADGSDEDFCVLPLCDQSYECRNQQCIPYSQVCDGMQHCVDNSDEDCAFELTGPRTNATPPAIVHFDNAGRYRILHFSGPCPDTHFRCSDGLCLPVFVRCNGMDDCSGKEDELHCDTYTCPGFYRCRGSTVCLHMDHLCDGVYQCPEQDDELFCNTSCPAGCVCQGLAFVCSEPFPVGGYPDLRFLDGHKSGMKPSDFQSSFFLVGLKLSKCQLKSIGHISNENLRYLDLSENLFSRVCMSSFSGLKNLKVLILSGNPISKIYGGNSLQGIPSLRTVDISLTNVEVYYSHMFVSVPGLQSLNMSHGRLTQISQTGFNTTAMLETLDLRESHLRDYPIDMLMGLRRLKTLFTDDFRLCCRATLPEHFDLKNCHTQMDDIASCEDLLRSNVYRVFLWMFAGLALLGNAGSFVTRFWLQRQVSVSQTSFSTFVTNLSIADFLMGVYLAMIGVADHLYKGEYLWYDEEWKKSSACKIAGFLSLLSSEVSAFNICLITLDRFLVLRYPFSRLHFRKWSAIIACGITWAIGAALAAVPLLPMTSHWEFYSQNGICIPLPITKDDGRFQGHEYSFGIMIVLNFALFVLIAVGQVCVYLSIKTNTMSAARRSRAREAAIAQRLATVVLSDFLCWFPIGLLGLLAATGTHISSEVNVGIAIFVLPFNSALNPFLYTFNIIWERRRKAMESRLMTKLESRHVSAMTPSVNNNMHDLNPSKESLFSLLDICLEKKILAPEDVVAYLSLQLTTGFTGNKEDLQEGR